MKNDIQNGHDKIAIIDIGSNSVRLFVFEITGDKTNQIMARKFFCGLGRDLAITGKLDPEAVEKSVSILVSFRTEIAKLNIKSEIVIGTAALREASDADVFINRVRKESGFSIQIIEGEEEARLAALAVLSGNPAAKGVVADFGGGSLELANIDAGLIQKKISLKLGAHYLKVLRDRETAIKDILLTMLDEHKELRNPSILYVIGGSWRSLAKAWLQDKGEPDGKVEGLTFQGNEILDFCKRLEKMTPAELIEIYRMEEPRAQIIDVSALMLAKLILNLNPGHIEISAAGIRDGLAYDYILKQMK